MEKAKSSFSLSGFALMAGVIAAMLIGMFILKPINTPEDIENIRKVLGNIVVLLRYLPQIGTLIAFWLVITKLPKVEWKKEKMSIWEIIKMLAMAYTVSMVFLFLGDFITKLISVGGSEQLNVVSSLMNSNSIWAILIPTILAPVVEELIFRKLLIDRLHNYGEKAVIIFTAICFGLFHGNLTQALFGTCAGLFLGYVYCKTGNIFYTLFMHIALNTTTTSLSLPMQMLSGAREKNIVLMVLPLVWIAFLLIVGLVTFIRHLIKKDIQLDETMPTAIPKNLVFKTVYLNIGVILYLVFHIYLVIVDLFNLPFFNI